jgi:predicted type IV restriction endonuclease
MAEGSSQKLADTLHKLRKRIEQIQDRQEIVGEQNTKATLIDPLLSALGWDLEELDEVCREYKRKPQDNPVDYALFIHRSPVLFVEAKSLKGNLSDRKWISQTLGYATVVGVEWCVLTNGDEYRLYNSHATVDVEEKLFRVVRLSESTQDDYTIDTLDLLSKDRMGENRLDVLWKAHFIDRHIKQALDNLFRNEDPGFIRLIRKKTKGISPSEIKESLKRADIRIDFPLIASMAQGTASSIMSQASKPVDRPKSIRKHKKEGHKVYIGVEVSDLITAGLIAPPLTLIAPYKGARLQATIRDDGTVAFDGSSYPSLSAAASKARETVVGRLLHTNGWTFWKYTDPQSRELNEIDNLRQQYLKRIHKS